MAILATLALVEALILAHKAAKLQDDQTATKLIESALRHVGCKLEAESLGNDGSNDAADDEIRGGGNDGHRKIPVH